MARDTYEVYYHQNGRWSVHQTFESNQRELAIAEAQNVEKTTGTAVRVVRETFYPETNTTEEAVTWQNAKAKQMPDADNMFGEKQPQVKKLQRPKAAPERRPQKDDSADAALQAPKTLKKRKRKKKKKANKKSRGVLTKVAIVVSMSLLMSVTAVLVTVLGLYGAVKMGLAPEEDRSFLVAVVFLIAYVVSAIYQLGKQFNIKYGLGFSLRKKSPAASPADMIKRMQRANTDEPAFQTAVVTAPIVDEATLAEMRENVAAEDAALEAEQTGDRGDTGEFVTEIQQAEDVPQLRQEPPAPEETQPATTAAPAPPPPQAAAPPPLPEPPKPPKPEKKEEKPPERPSNEVEARAGFMAFVNGALSAAQSEQPQLNAFSRFGLNLYLAGACSAIGQAKKVARNPQLMMLRDGLQAAGNNRERADGFCVELPSHGKNPRYAGMVQAGSEAMKRHMGGQSAAAGEIGALLGEWARPEKRPTVPSVFTFMFTDIVNSTALTSQLGNAGAQRVVRAHNTAVRGAIQAVGGREVKHTGDGIMAVFPSPITAVQAGIRMQKEIAAHNASNPSVAFAVRIGINVGEAVEEDNDFFGGAVQMSARVCAQATAQNVWVSQPVVDACKGQRIGFIPRGAFSMKGIQQARPLYEVAFTDAHRNELSNL